MPATDTRTMLLVDLPLCIGTTGSLARVLHAGRVGAGPHALRRARAPAGAHRARRRPRAAPHRRRSSRGSDSMAGEFVRTPKKGVARRAATAPRADLPTSRSRSRCSRSSASSPRSRPATGSRRRSRCSSRSATATSPSCVAREQAARRREARRARPAGTSVPATRGLRQRCELRRAEPRELLGGLCTPRPPEQVRIGLARARGASGAGCVPMCRRFSMNSARLRP